MKKKKFMRVGLLFLFQVMVSEVGVLNIWCPE